MNYNRDNKGRFSSGKMWLWGILFLVVASVGCVMWISQQPRFEVAMVASDVTKLDVVEKLTKEQYEAKIKQLKSDVLDDLSLGCEVKGLADPDGTIVFDSNRVASIGRFQFQVKTIKFYIKKFEGRDITGREAIEIAVDPVKAKALAERIIFGEGKTSDWANCSAKFNLQTTVNIINKLSL